MTHILLIDDRRDDRLLVARELERVIDDLRITEIAAAPALNQALAEASFDLAIVDYQLHWSNGVEVLRALKARCPDRPVIMFSATATAENAVAAMREGLDDYISKSPRHYRRLALAVPAALERAATRERIAALEAQQAAWFERERAARQKAEQLADRLGRLQAVTAALTSALQPAAVAQAVTEQCVLALSARASAVMAVDWADRTLQLLYQTGYGAAFQGWERSPLDGPYPFSDVVRDGAPLYVPSRAAFNARYPLLAATPTITEAAAYLPLTVDGRVLGAISIGFATPRVLEDDERAFLEALASQCAQALERARLFEAAQRANQRLALLAEASTQLVASLDYGETLRQIARLCVPRLADWCVVDMPDQDGTLVMQIIAHVDPAMEQWVRSWRERNPITMDMPSAAQQVILSGEPLLLPDIPDAMIEQAARDAEELDMLRSVGYRSMLIVPLRAHERTIGSLALVTTTASGRRYTPDDLTLLEELARRAGVALDNARLYAESQEAVRTRDQFLAIASHELKTPLTSLLGHTQLLTRRLARGEGDPERTRRALQVITSQGQRLNHLITSLLDLSRLQNGQMQLSLAPLDLHALAEQVVAEMQTEFERPRIALDAPGAPVMIQGDGLRLEQVLINLLQNAVKYSDPDTPITVTLEQDGASAVLAVRDQGIGIPAEVLPHIFGRFYRAPNIDSQNISGMGMGLFLVHEVVSRHDGHVGVSSAVGQGTVFTVTLPLSPQTDLEEQDA
ncbi:MAG TPA: ATP-binding protein [Roseiflexaceae bacterium]|nr:ATP-binding protein [Roseiflexaceae bacterium]